MKLPDGFELGPREVAFHFETDTPIDARRLARFVSAMSEELSRAPHVEGNVVPVPRSFRVGASVTVIWELPDRVAQFYCSLGTVNRLSALAVKVWEPRWLRTLAEVMDGDGIPVMRMLAADDLTGLPRTTHLVREQMPVFEYLHQGYPAAGADDDRRTALALGL